MESNRFRCHPSIIIERLGGTFWLIVLMLISSVDDFSSALSAVAAGEVSLFEALLGMGIFFLIIVIGLVANWIVWLKTYISIDDEAIVVERNLLNRKVRTIGMKNISNINMEQNIFERIIGTYKIKLDTNSSTTANETDVQIILSKEKALWFKNEVMLRMKGETEEAVLEEADEIMEYDVEYTMQDILKHCLFTANPISVIFCLGVIGGLIFSMRIANFDEEFMSSIVEILGGLFAVFIVVLTVFQSLVQDFFVYYGFKAKRQGEKIYLSHGLLKKRQYTIAVDKINGIKMVAPVVSRIFGRQYVQVVCVGVGDEKNENSKILLAEKTEDIEEKLALLLPEFDIRQPKLMKRHKCSLWKEVCNIILTGIVCVVAMYFVGVRNVLEIDEVLWRVMPVTIFCAIVFASTVLGNVLRYQTAKVGLSERNLFIVNGTYGKVSVWIPYSKIQELDLTQGPLARHFGYGKGVIFILATVLDKVYLMNCFPMELFGEIEKKMLIRKGRVHAKEKEA